jgi:hypothetical protein
MKEVQKKIMTEIEIEKNLKGIIVDHHVEVQTEEIVKKDIHRVDQRVIVVNVIENLSINVIDQDLKAMNVIKNQIIKGIEQDQEVVIIANIIIKMIQVAMK